MLYFVRILLALMMICAIPLNFIPLRESAWAIYCSLTGLKKKHAEEDSADVDDSEFSLIKTPLKSRDGDKDEESDDAIPEMSTTRRWISTIVLLSSSLGLGWA